MKLLLGILAFALSLSLADVSTANQTSLSTLEATSTSDGFVLSSIKKEENESFVYTGYLNFESGQAGGLVFGAEDNDHYFVFNMDRYENKVKVLYFYESDGSLTSSELLSEPFIGNDKMTDSEKAMVNPKIRTLDQVNLKIILTNEDDKTYVEFYADGIKRFGVDNTYDLNTLQTNVNYTGGYIGINVFAGKVNLSDISIGKSDYSYYSELYRNQYHFSQFSHWNNDPNGLVYYKGYYHLYYQTHPFSKYWSDMYWGHARSKDLIHWENLPICLFPDNGTMGIGTGDGYMWSGSSMVYHKGMSSLIDSYNWFGESGEGLIAFFTRDGSGSQDQVIMSSDDEGMTWTKRKLIPQSITGISDRKIDFRDPKVFPVTKNGDAVTRWGMTVSDMGSNIVYILESTDLINWNYSTKFYFDSPECIDVVTLDYNGDTKNVITICGRYYLVGKFTYTDKIVFINDNGEDISTLSLDNIEASTMDYGPDSYATQSFYIDDSTSEYYGKYVSMSWFSGVPGDSRSVDSGTFASVRHPWNGGGMTIPVIYSLGEDNSKLCLKETPITKDNNKLTKTNIVNSTNITYDPTTSENPLKDVNSHIIELSASIDNPNSYDVSFRIDVSSKEYLEIGWNITDGYYVDRSHLTSANLSFSNYNEKYTSNVIGDNKKQTFYILSDNGGVEVYANDFKTPFYVLTLASPYSRNAEFKSSGAVTITNLEVSEIASTYRKNVASDEGIIYLSEADIDLDLSLHTEETITAYCTAGDNIQFSVTEGNDVIDLNINGNEAKVTSKKEGEATIKVNVGIIEKTCKVKVYNSSQLSLPFDENGIKAGSFYQDGDSIVGTNKAGDGYLLSSKTGSDFLYQARLDITEAKAAALIVKASEDMSRYICINYDKSLSACKVWSNTRQLAYVNLTIEDLSSILISVKSEGEKLQVSVNGNVIIDATMNDEEKETGYFGLNVFQGKAIFSSINVSSFDFEYNGGDLNVELPSLTSLKSVINLTNKITNIPLSYCSIANNILTIKKEYFSTLKEKKTYKILIQGYSESYEVNIDVKDIPVIKLENKTLESNENAVYFIGSRIINKVTLNGSVLNENQYFIKDYCLTIYASNLQEGFNTLKINEDEEVEIMVNKIQTTNNTNISSMDTIKNSIKNHKGSYLAVLISIISLVTMIIVVNFLKRKEKAR